MVTILDRISWLCDELKNEIYEFIPRAYLVWTNKEYYTNYHGSIQRFLVDKSLYDAYIRHIIRKDLHFPLSIVITTHQNPTWKTKRYKFRNAKYENYLHFMDCFMFENNAHKCRNVLFTYVFRKKYKKTNRNISWSN